MTTTNIRLRSATPADSSLLWRWKNDSEAVAQSFSMRKVTRKEHKTWFGARWDHPNHLFYLAEIKNGQPVGLVRFDHEWDQAICSLYIDPQWRGQGLGAAINWTGAVCCFERWDVTAIIAQVKINNIASRKAFERAGYSHARTEIYQGFTTITLTLYRKNNDGTTNDDCYPNTKASQCP
ncbi:hypothetical protein DSUL_150076 [Desulfovibrionales bacterium]